MRSSSACVLLNAQNLADRGLTFVDSIVSRSRGVDDRPAALRAARCSRHHAEGVNFLQHGFTVVYSRHCRLAIVFGDK